MKKFSEKKAVKTKKKKKLPFFVKLWGSMVLLGVILIVGMGAVMRASGEFTSIREYACNLLTDKTDNRASYVESLMTRKSTGVYTTAEKINNEVKSILEEQDKSITDIRTDKELNKSIILGAGDNLVELLRQNVVNDVFIFLNTDSLYEKDETELLTGLYIRDDDIKSNESIENKDLFVEMGSPEAAQSLGITMDYEWSLYADTGDGNDYSFFYEPIKAYAENPSSKAYDLGYWSSSSKISRSSLKSIKYTLPLIYEDGTLYGVIGIGLLEKTIQDQMPAYDFFSGNVSYVLAEDADGTGVYSPLLYSGSAYTRLVSDDTVFDESDEEEHGLFSFNTKIESIGSINELTLYSTSSPYKNQKWVLLSVADADSILSVYNRLINTFVLMSIVAAVFSTLFAALQSRRITKPVSGMIKELEKEPHGGSTVHFKKSGITEIDKLADAIVELQIKVEEQSSRVSNIISMADSGIGVFMYECKKGTVFMGKSLAQIFEFPDFTGDKDITVSFEDFMRAMEIIDRNRILISSGIFFYTSDTKTCLSKNAELLCMHGNMKKAKWLKFTVTRDKDTVMGIVQDITQTVLERKKIEHERDYDITTGLYNRRAFYAHVDAIFANPQILGVTAVVMLDLDNLKFVNDTYGHDFGDDYLRAAANAIKAMAGENVISARLSGDEFVMLIYGGQSKDQLRKFIAATRDTLLSSSCQLSDGTSLKVRASGGVAWYPDDAPSYEVLIKYADFAMYSVKHSTKGNIAEFDISTYSSDSILVTGIEEMNRIIDENDIKFAFQVIVSANDGEVFGYEALMRPQSKIIASVLELLRIAKSCAKLYEIERITWLGALKRFSEMISAGIISDKTRVFINSISNCKLSEEQINEIEIKYASLTDNVVLEMLEGEQTNREYADFKKKRMSDWDALIALDDFGTGYNSEYALITMHPDLIKIDRSIIEGCDKDISKFTMIKNLVKIAKQNNVKVLAEGIETRTEMETVIRCGADFLQGYYLSRPVFEPNGITEKVKKEILSVNAEKNSRK